MNRKKGYIKPVLIPMIIFSIIISLLVFFSTSAFANLGQWRFNETAELFFGNIEIEPPAGGPASRHSDIAADTHLGVASAHWAVSVSYVAADGDGVVNDIALFLNTPALTRHITAPHPEGMENPENGILTHNLVLRNVTEVPPFGQTVRLKDASSHGTDWDEVEIFVQRHAVGGPAYLYVWCRHKNVPPVPGDTCAVQPSQNPGATLISPFDGEASADPNISFIWTDLNLSGYEIQVSGDPTFYDLEFIDFTFSPIHNGFSLLPFSTYFWRVRGIGDTCTDSPWSTVFSFTTADLPTCTFANGIEHCPVGDMDIFIDPAGPVTLIPFNFTEPTGVQLGIAGFEGISLELGLASWWNNPNATIMLDGRSEIDFPQSDTAEFETQLGMVLNANGLDPVINVTINPVNPQDQQLTGFVIHHYLIDPQQGSCGPTDFGRFFKDGNSVILNSSIPPGSEPDNVNVQMFSDGSISIFYPQPVDFSGTESSFLANGILYQPLYDGEYANQVIAHENAHIIQVSLTTQSMGDLTINEELIWFSDHLLFGTGDSKLSMEGESMLIGDTPTPPVEGIKGMEVDLDSVTKISFCLDRDSLLQPFGDTLKARVHDAVPGGPLELIVKEGNGPVKILRVNFAASGSTQMWVQTFNSGIVQSEDNAAIPAFWISLIPEDPDKIVAGIDENTGQFYYECIWHNPIEMQINEGPTVTIDKIRFQDTNGVLPGPFTGAKVEMKGEGSLKFEKITSCKDVRLIGRAPFEGPYNESSGLMDNQRAEDDLLPDVDPFGLGENMGAGLDPSSQSGPDAIVDWIKADLRNRNDPNQILFSKAGFVRRDGVIVGTDGVPGIRLPNVESGSYVPSIKGQGHLNDYALQGLVLDPFSNSCGESFIFYSPAGEVNAGSQAGGPGGPGGPGNPGGNLISNKPGPVEAGSKTLINGVWVITSGDTNGDSIIDSADRSNAWNFRNQSGYLSQDVNWDGVVDSADRSVIWNNRNQSSQPPGN